MVKSDGGKALVGMPANIYGEGCRTISSPEPG